MWMHCFDIVLFKYHVTAGFSFLFFLLFLRSNRLPLSTARPYSVNFLFTCSWCRVNSPCHLTLGRLFDLYRQKIRNCVAEQIGIRGVLSNSYSILNYFNVFENFEKLHVVPLLHCYIKRAKATPFLSFVWKFLDWRWNHILSTFIHGS